jgi:curli production assembly/transport component CsgG
MVYSYRENIGNLLQERNLIRSTRQEYTANADLRRLKLRLYYMQALLLEGGIISYDSNIITGGFARYFGTGASVRYRQDRVTIYLRMVSTANGKILQFIFLKRSYRKQLIKVF